MLTQLRLRNTKINNYITDKVAEYNIINFELENCEMTMSENSNILLRNISVINLKLINVRTLYNKHFNQYPFNEMLNLNKLTIINTPIRLSEYIFSNYKKLKNVILSNSINSINNNILNERIHLFNSFNMEYNTMTCADLRQFRGLNSNTIKWSKGNKLTCTRDDLTRLNISTRIQFFHEILTKSVENTTPTSNWFFLFLFEVVVTLSSIAYVYITYFKESTSPSLEINIDNKKTEEKKDDNKKSVENGDENRKSDEDNKYIISKDKSVDNKSECENKDIIKPEET